MDRRDQYRAYLSDVSDGDPQYRCPECGELYEEDVTCPDCCMDLVEEYEDPMTYAEWTDADPRID